MHIHFIFFCGRNKVKLIITKCITVKSLKFVEKSYKRFYRLFINVLLLEIQLSRSEGWDPINQITLQDLDLQRHMSWSFCD
jgi:hypothetical protein